MIEKTDEWVAREARIWMRECGMDLMTTASVLGIPMERLAAIVARDSDGYRSKPIELTRYIGHLSLPASPSTKFMASNDGTASAWRPNGQREVFDHRKRRP